MTREREKVKREELGTPSQVEEREVMNHLSNLTYRTVRRRVVWCWAGVRKKGEKKRALLSVVRLRATSSFEHQPSGDSGR
jgi:hypothetical protein